MRSGHLTLARDNRANATPAERLLWSRLRAGRMAGFKFRRQVPLGPFIVDFLCHEAALIIELDGSQHAKQRDADAARTVRLERLGYRVLRFGNVEMMQQPEAVLRTIYGAIVAARREVAIQEE